MPKFTINLSSAISEKENLRLKLADYVDTSRSIFDNVKASKNVWTDPASLGFNKIVLDDEYKAKEVVSNIKKYYDNLDIYTDELSKIFLKREFDLSTFKISYDSTYMNLSLNSITTINKNLGDAKEYASNPECPSGFEYRDEVNNMSGDINNIIGSFTSLYNDLNSIYKDIDDIHNKVSLKHRTIEFKGISGAPTRFVWSLVSTIKQQEVELVGATKIDISSRDIGIEEQQPITFNLDTEYGVVDNTIESNQPVVEKRIEETIYGVTDTTYVANEQPVGTLLDDTEYTVADSNNGATGTVNPNNNNNVTYNVTGQNANAEATVNMQQYKDMSIDDGVVTNASQDVSLEQVMNVNDIQMSSQSASVGSVSLDHSSNFEIGKTNMSVDRTSVNMEAANTSVENVMNRMES